MFCRDVLFDFFSPEPFAALGERQISDVVARASEISRFRRQHMAIATL